MDRKYQTTAAFVHGNNRFFERYIIYDQVLGTGGQAVVWKGYDKSRKKPVAIKIYDKTSMKMVDLKDARREIKIIDGLNHQNITKLVDSYEDAQELFLVMDLMLMDLDMFLSSSRLRGISDENVKLIFYQMLAAVEHCHSHGIVHRDVKLKNFFIDNPENKGELLVKLGDFGFAEIGQLGQQYSEQVGTYHAMAPEIEKGKRYTEKVDCWSLGVILFQLLTRRKNNNGAISNEELLINASHDAIDLLFALLDEDESTRISVTQAMMHPWFN